MATEFIPITIRDLMLAGDAPAGLALALGAGNTMRVFPVESDQGADFPNVVYHQLNEDIIFTKDGSVSAGADLMVEFHAEQPGGYITTRRLARLGRIAIDGKTIDVEEDHHLAGEFSSYKLKYTGKEDLPPEPDTGVVTTALTFKATKQ